MARSTRHRTRRNRLVRHSQRGPRRSDGQLGIESLESRIALDGTGLAGNECPPDLDLSAVPAQQAVVGQLFTLDLLAAGGTVEDLNADDSPTGDTLRFVLDPDVPTDTPTGASITADGVFTWTPTAGQEGTFDIVVIVVDEGTPPLADAETFSITVSTDNLAPEVDLNGAVTGIDFSTAFTEDGGPVAAVDPVELTVADANDTNLESATVTLTNAADGANELLAVVTSSTNITAVYNDSTGILSLTGSDTLANYQTVLRSLTYDNTSQNPTEGDRTIEVVVSDGDDSSATATSTVTVTAQNDAPVVDLDSTDPSSDFQAAFTEGAGPIAIVESQMTIVDEDDTMLSSATVTITNLLDGTAEVLAVNTDTTGITAEYNDATGMLTLTGTETVATFQQVIRTLTYDNSSSDPDATSRLVEITVSDGVESSIARTSTVTIATVNDDPDLAPIANQIGFVDEELVIQITASDNDSGDTLTFELDTDNSPVGATIEKTGDTSAVIRWTPDSADQGATVGFVVLVSDDATPTNGIDSESFSVDVNPPRPTIDLNGDDPGTGLATTFTEGDSPVLLAEADLDIATNSSPTIASATVTITNLQDGIAEGLEVDDSLAAGISASYLDGVLTLTGSDTIANYELVLATLTYENTSEDPTAGDRTIQVVVNDGTSNSLPATATVSVVAVNDNPNLAVPPVFANGGSLEVEVGLQTTFSVVISDLDHGPGELFYQIDADSSGLPEGANLPTISASDADPPGQFTWVTDTEGTFTFRIIVTDAAGGVDQELVTFVVTPLTPPAVVSAPSGTIESTFSSFDVMFSEPIEASSFAVSNFVITVVGGPNDGQQVAVSSVDSSTDRTTATVNLTGPLANENYRLTLVDTAIIGSQNQTLSGDDTFDFTIAALAQAFADF